MDNKKYIEQVLNILYDFNKQNDQFLLEDDISAYLENFGIESDAFRASISDIRTATAEYVKSRISDIMPNKDLENSILKRYNIKNQGDPKNPYFTHMNVSFKGKEEAPTRDLIKLYIPLKTEGLEYNLKLIYNFLFENQINFQSKLSNDIRSDLFVVRVDKKEDALKVIDFCNDTPIIKEQLGFCNPFIPIQDGIGIGRDTYYSSYNEFVASTIKGYLEEVHQNNENHCNFSSFVKFIEDQTSKYAKYTSPMDDKYNFMNRVLLSNMNVINDNSKPLDQIEDSYNINYNYDLFSKYEISQDERHNCQYKNIETGVYVPFQSKEWIELQAMKYLHEAYQYDKKVYPTKSYKVSDEYCRNCLSTIDKYQDANLVPNPDSYKNSKMDEFYPYFYAYLALQLRNASVDNAILISNAIDKTIIKTTEKQENQYNGVKFMSSIPIINIESASVGIEMIYSDVPNVKGLCNISVIKDGTITKYNNVYIDLDESLLYPNEENAKYSKMYRSSIGHLLSDLDRNKRMMEKRDGHFGILKFDEEIGLRKFTNPEYISMIASYKQSGLLPSNYQEKGKIVK